MKPARRRELAHRVKSDYCASIRIACDVLSISVTCYSYEARLSDENAEIADWLLRLTTANKRWGFGLCFMFLRNTKGFKWNQQITLLYIQPGKPTQNAYIERFNRTARQEWLELTLFEDIEHAQLLATQWQWTYNNYRPHSAIGGVPPRQLA